MIIIIAEIPLDQVQTVPHGAASESALRIEDFNYLAMKSSKSRRRVPDQLRKRAAISCDLCKVRRRKCVRSTAEQSSCKLCLEHNVECTSTIPRKPRIHVPGPEDNSQTSHLRALEDLVNNLFPEVNTNNTDEIIQLSQAIEHGNRLISHCQSDSRRGVLEAENASNINTEVRSNTAELQNSITHQGSQSTSTVEQTQTSSITSFYERMLQSPSGTLSYFGSSSSMAYVRKMRELLAAEADGRPGVGSNESLRHTFIRDQYARTMGEDQGAVPELPAIDYVQLESQRPSEQGAVRLLKLLQALPSKKETDDLVELFFTQVHINIALFHRPSFQAILDRIRSPETQTIDVGWAVCFRLAIAFGCEWRLSTLSQRDNSEWERLTSMKRQLVNDSFLEISHLMLSGTLQAVTAFALFSVYMNFANERNASWVLSGCAVRMAIGLGLHRGNKVVHRSDIYFLPLEKELRKQIWCSLYIFEQYASAFLGRPSALEDVEIIVDLPNESILDQGFYWPPGYLQHDVTLARIVGKIREAQMDQSLSLSNDLQGLPNIRTCHQLLHDLDNWKENLPAFLDFDERKLDHAYPSHMRQILMIHVRYQYARIMLTRPFLLRALYISHGLNASITANAEILNYKDVCFQGALDCWKLIHCLWKRGRYNANLWLDGVFAYQCNLILSLYLLDTSKTSDPSQLREIHEMVKQIQDILHKGPGNRTMRRLIQISRDFSEIVSPSSTSPALRENINTSKQLVESGPRHSQFPSNLNAYLDAFSRIPQMLDLNPSAFNNWESTMGSNLFHGDFMGESFMFDPLADLDFGPPMESENP
ncbi:transcriptional regulatory protein [Penicillium lagena]|uniref:transcriptional regulatory protein n=1 Tax=Penicillium lagena TaxID=94218 RepID=UPI0025407471|nr:transcriptional regulatory protein [Penicillium lagena]KAJ5602032.1 transcriptional regulatory protein [Penicillium lagena]